jgi:4-hydroxy-tetrahydrodipicolinate synthase
MLKNSAKEFLMTPFQERLCGNVPAVLTALDKNFDVDREGLRRITARMIDNRCQGVVVLGTTGEFAAVDDAQRSIAIKIVVDEVAGRVPVIVGCGQPNVRRTHEQAKVASDLGADGLLINPPFYFPMTQLEVVHYFADLVSVSALPVLLYNIPKLTKVTVEPATIAHLRDVGVEGVKDSSGIPANTLAYLAALGPATDFRVIVGGDAFFLHLLDAGVCATTGLLSNIAPGRFRGSTTGQCTLSSVLGTSRVHAVCWKGGTQQTRSHGEVGCAAQDSHDRRGGRSRS